MNRADTTPSALAPARRALLALLDAERAPASDCARYETREFMARVAHVSVHNGDEVARALYTQLRAQSPSGYVARVQLGAASGAAGAVLVEYKIDVACACA